MKAQGSRGSDNTRTPVRFARVGTILPLWEMIYFDRTSIVTAASSGGATEGIPRSWKVTFQSHDSVCFLSLTWRPVMPESICVKLKVATVRKSNDSQAVLQRIKQTNRWVD